MNLLSAYYLAFILGALVVYYLLPKNAQWCWLLVVSLAFFVLSCGWMMAPYLLFGIAVAYGGAVMMQKSETSSKKKGILAITLLLILGELAALKYLNFFPSTINVFAKLFSVEWRMQTVLLIAPIGISYYTLSLVGYVLDVYWGTYTPERNFAKVALFGCYFPQMTSGPVMRFQEMKDALFSGHRLNYQNITFGAQRILWGFFKKLLIAEWLIIFVRNVYADALSLPGCLTFIATICYAFYLYADFSGCMDIVIGTSEMFGIRMPENFERPFFSLSLGEFWRRWHITLGLWFKDYLLYPLLKSDRFQSIKAYCKNKWGKNAAKKIPTYLGLCVLWLAIGFWHQGSWRYIVAAGIIPGCYLIFGDLLQPCFEWLKRLLRVNTTCFSYRLFQRVRTLLLMCVVFLFVNTSGVMDAFRTLHHIVRSFRPTALLNGNLLSYGLDARKWLVVLFSLAVLLVVSILNESKRDVRTLLSKQNLPFRWAVYIVLIIVVMLFSPSMTPGVGEFMYAQF